MLLLFVVQSYVAPFMAPVNDIGLKLVPVQSSVSKMGSTEGTGFT